MTTIKSIISTATLYIMFGVWSFIHMMEYKYFTRIEQYDSIVDNMDRCNKKYTELLLKMIHMENRIAELEDILYITDELNLEEETPVTSLEVEKSLETDQTVAPKVEEDVVKESSSKVLVEEIVEEMIKLIEVEESVTPKVLVEELEEETVTPKVVVETVAVDNFDAGELVDLSTEEKETNSNKKGWVKTLLFL